MKSRCPLKRFEKNPIITPDDMPFECYTVYNAGAVRFKDEYLLLLRVETRERVTSFHVARSLNGYDFKVDSECINYPLRDLEKEWGCHRFDMRITPLDGTFYICHALWLGKLGCVSAMARTDDFIHFEAVGSITMPSNRNSVLFPEKIDGLYVRLERPQNIDGSGQMWINYSPDLVYWGNPKPLKMPYASWASRKSGPGAIPIRTDKGWLEIYHATCNTASTENYYLGAMLLDLEDPSKVIAAPRRFILAPEKDYECMGQVPNVVFTGGAVLSEDRRLMIYYGGADTRMCLAEAPLDELVSFCLDE